MKKIFTNSFSILGMTVCLFFFPNCRGDILPTEEDLANYGWDMYEAGNFLDAREWFGDALKKDSSYYDSYNGMGWTMGHLRQADSSVHYFSMYLSNDTNFVDKLDFYAGLSFGYNALGDDVNARKYCNIFFGNQNPILDPDWVFSHNKKINHLDVRLVLAVSEFHLALFDNCQSSINKIYKDAGSSIVVDVDVTSVQGRAVLASHIASLQTTLKNS
ncbi:MAG: hypothetical protein CMG57_03500 [Candidatus Marinimicrobia bacterium]|nr:hypothetical protein [Candidatus Neomarinimicrobiota bacterium]|tara:strand:- start:1113 stop:1760 length:648 start_codon:yes stop_codon:yes gene_type:complete